ncbi:hypothetical protein Zmor_000566 [Zophobas morio]|uniref:Uncharacterized protein n=1 Tax=Zophobas morio TaxID=2755281 RepID=A0AA38J2Z8_9CUCU|nr:hypothetical protein Zmor_000566 [Zophobas morio]
MKKKQREAKSKHSKNKLEQKSTTEPPDSEEEESFSKWLRSSEGLENLKLFVIGNSVLIFLLVSWPQIKETLETAYYMYIEYQNNVSLTNQ